MTEIEKMFENAGIEPVDYKLEPMRTLKFSVDDIGNTWTREQYMKEVSVYPPFTAEKQIKIVKFLFNHSVLYDVDSKGNYWFHISDDCYTYYYNKFEVALANIINEMWQSLTDQEKEEIRRILNENS